MSDTFNEFDKTLTRPQRIRETRVSTEAQAKKTLEEQTLALDKAQRGLVDYYKNEARVPVRVAPSYAKYFGRVMRVALNGIIVSVKCDGNTVNLPQSFAAEVLSRMAAMDQYELRLNKMAQTKTNCETTAGQINFFG